MHYNNVLEVARARMHSLLLRTLVSCSLYCFCGFKPGGSLLYTDKKVTHLFRLGPVFYLFIYFYLQYFSTGILHFSTVSYTSQCWKDFETVFTPWYWETNLLPFLKWWFHSFFVNSLSVTWQEQYNVVLFMGNKVLHQYVLWKIQKYVKMSSL